MIRKNAKRVLLAQAPRACAEIMRQQKVETSLRFNLVLSCFGWRLPGGGGRTHLSLAGFLRARGGALCATVTGKVALSAILIAPP
jgi:hypothetical protein